MAAPRPKSPHRLHAHALSNSSTLSNSIDMREDISFFSVSRENAPHHQTHHPLRCIRHITCGVHLLARSSDRWRLWLLWRWQIWRRTAHSASRVEYGVAYRAKRAEQFHNELRYSVGIQLSSAVWTNRTAGWELALSNSFDALSNSFEQVPRDKECAVVQSLKPKVAHFVTLEFSFDAVPRGVLKLQNVGSRMLLLEFVGDGRRQCVRHRGWSIHVGWHRPRRTGRNDVAAGDGDENRVFVLTKGPGARDGERSFGRHPSNSFTTPDTKRTKGQGPGMVNVLLAAIHSDSFTTSGD